MKNNKIKPKPIRTEKIPKNWRTLKLGYLCHIKYGKGLPERERKQGNYPIYGSNGIVYWHERPFVPGPGIIVGRKGSIGTVEFTEKDFWPIDTTFFIEPPKQGAIDLKFLYYQLKSANLKSLGGTDSAVPGLNRDALADYDLYVPPVDEQQKIAGVLGVLDEKIELNRKMNKTLESLAQTIFKKWFVFGENQMPLSYTTSSLDKIAQFLNGLPLQKHPPMDNTDALPVIKIRELKSESTLNSDKASSKIDKQYIVENGDVLFSWSGSLEVTLWGGGRGALNQHLFKVTSDEYPKWFFYFWIKYYLESFQAIAAGKATTMGHIQRHHLTNARVSIADNKTMQKLDTVLSPIVDLIIKNKNETATLSQIRDSLLPRLMTGKLRVG